MIAYRHRPEYANHVRCQLVFSSIGRLLTAGDRTTASILIGLFVFAVIRLSIAIRCRLVAVFAIVIIRITIFARLFIIVILTISRPRRVVALVFSGGHSQFTLLPIQLIDLVYIMTVELVA